MLVSGPWGLGKTFLVKKFLAEHFENQKDYVYVSLYGLSTLEDVDDALFQAMFPHLTGTAAKVIGRVAKSALKIMKVDASEFDVRDFLNKYDAKVYVFDDLERFDGTIHKVLGLHQPVCRAWHAKVILVANEQEISVNNDYSRRCEKLLGKALHVESSFSEAFAYFVSKTDDAHARKFVESCETDIETIYDQSELNNLRILQQTIWDFERFYKAVSAEHRQNHDAWRSSRDCFSRSRSN